MVRAVSLLSLAVTVAMFTCGTVIPRKSLTSFTQTTVAWCVSVSLLSSDHVENGV